MSFIKETKYFFEKHGFAVSSRLADRLGMRAKNVRLFFIYLTFATLGISLKLKDLVYTKRTSVFDL